MSAALEGRDLACIRGERLVFAQVSFAIAAGDALILTGPNGAGKSTLLRLIAGYLKPADGQLLWNGRAVGSGGEAVRQDLHYIGHLDGVKTVLTVRENLDLWARLRAAEASAVDSALERFGLLPLADFPARFLSAGQKRRLNLARLLASPARLWLLDEPAVGLDAHSCGVLAQVVNEHRAGGGLVIAATHMDLGFAGTHQVRLNGGGDWGVP